MGKNFEVEMLNNRLNKLMSRGDKNIKQGGVVRKIKRMIRNAQEND